MTRSRRRFDFTGKSSGQGVEGNLAGPVDESGLSLRKSSNASNARNASNPSNASNASKAIIAYEHPSANPSQVTEFKFNDLTKKTKQIRKVQKLIQREMSIDFMDPMLKAGYWLIQRVQHMTGRQKKTLHDLFNEEVMQVNEVASLLFGLSQACTANNAALFTYLDTLDDRLHVINTEVPPLYERTQQQGRRFKGLHQKVSSMDKYDPQRPLLNKQLRRERLGYSNVRNDLARFVNRRDRYGDISQKTENISMILLYGRDFAEQLGDAYFDVGECLEAVAPSIILANGLYSNENKFYEMVDQLGQNLREAYTIESNFENKAFVSHAYDSIPSLPPGKNTPQVVDHVNDAFKKQSEPLRHLFL